jgi:hypothetical protein
MNAQPTKPKYIRWNKPDNYCQPVNNMTLAASAVGDTVVGDSGSIDGGKEAASCNKEIQRVNR